MADAAHYEGREQTQIKHFVLEKYLERFAHIIGSWNDCISYVDCFSGPWENKATDMSDTSFAIALRELKAARENHAANGRYIKVRCLFLEKDRTAHAKLDEFARQQTSATASIETLKTDLLDAIPAINQFLDAGGPKSFPFLFIDPCGWSGFDIKIIGPLLRRQPSEVLVNFMTEDIRRWVTTRVTHPGLIGSFERLFGSREVFDRVSRIDNPLEREDELFTSYAHQLRTSCDFRYVCPSVVLHPIRDRSYFHLIYATRHPKGVAEFKKVEKSAFREMEKIRAGAKDSAEKRKTGTASLFTGAESPPSNRAVMLRERYTTAAREEIEKLIRSRESVSYDETWDMALVHPLVWESDLRGWIRGWKADEWIRVDGLIDGQREPKRGKGCVLVRLR